MSNRKNFEHLLLNSTIEISPNLYSKARYWNFRFNGRYVFKYDQPFPSELKLSAQKRAFIEQMYVELERQREEKNRKARERYKKKTQRKKPLPKDPRELEEKIIELEEDRLLQSVNTKPTVSYKSGKGVFFASKIKELRFIELDFGRELPVTQSSFGELWEKVLLPSFLNLYDKMATLKVGKRKFISKIITPYYDQDGKLMFDEDLYKKIDGVAVGNATKVRTKYSFGFSTSRTLEGITREEYEYGEMDRLREEFEMRVLTNNNAYIKAGYVKDIKISGILIEEVMKEEE